MTDHFLPGQSWIAGVDTDTLLTGQGHLPMESGYIRTLMADQEQLNAFLGK